MTDLGKTGLPADGGLRMNGRSFPSERIPLSFFQRLGFGKKATPVLNTSGVVRGGTPPLGLSSAGTPPPTLPEGGVFVTPAPDGAGRERFRDIFEIMPNAFVILDAVPGDDAVNPVDFVFTFVNPRFEMLIGRTREELIGRTLQSANPHLQTFHLELLTYVLSSWDSTLFVDETLLPGRVLKITLYRPAEHRIACLLEDVTSIRESEVALRRRHEVERRLALIATQLISCTRQNIDGIISDSLMQIGKFYGLMRCTVCRIDAETRRLGMTHEWCAPGSASLISKVQDLPVENFQWRISQLLEFGELWIPDTDHLPPEAAAEREFLARHGISALAMAALYEDDHLSGFVCFHLAEGPSPFHPSDMAVLHAFATTFSNAFWRLKMERMLQTRQDQMLQSQKLESIGRLAGGVAHDFNNMLSVILGFADLILERMPADDVNRKDLLEIHGAANRSRSLAGQLLAFARKQASEPRILNINRVISESENLLRKLAGEAVQLKITPGPELFDISMDATQLNQVLLNLIANARDAMPAGGVIEVTTRNLGVSETDPLFQAHLPPGEYVELTVADSGGGMTREVLEHLFEPFFTTKKTGQGTGLGLATVYGIVHQHHGEILVRSALGAGTTFSLYFPRARGAHGATTQNIPALYTDKGHETILLVEDEQALLRLGTSVLSRSGYRVLAADSPEKALSLVRSQNEQPDLLITDVIMPEMNGRELFAELRRDLPALPCLFMSGYTSDIIDRQGILEADVHFLQKPFRASVLLQKVRAVLDGDPAEKN